jgi:hypothetical protein
MPGSERRDPSLAARIADVDRGRVGAGRFTASTSASSRFMPIT